MISECIVTLYHSVMFGIWSRSVLLTEGNLSVFQERDEDVTIKIVMTRRYSLTVPLESSRFFSLYTKVDTCRGNRVWKQRFSDHAAIFGIAIQDVPGPSSHWQIGFQFHNMKMAPRRSQEREQEHFHCKIPLPSSKCCTEGGDCY